MKTLLLSLMLFAAPCSAVDFHVPIFLGLGAVRGVVREQTDNRLGFPNGVITAGLGVRAEFGHSLSVSDRLEISTGFTNVQSNILGLGMGFGRMRVGPEFGLHRQQNTEFLEDRCNSIFVNSDDCSASSRPVGTFRDASVYASLGLSLGMQVNRRSGFTFRLGMPVRVFSHSNVRSIHWITGWDDSPHVDQEGDFPNRERLGVLAAVLYTFEI
jgi:hypothetical protein